MLQQLFEEYEKLLKAYSKQYKERRSDLSEDDILNKAKNEAEENIEYKIEELSNADKLQLARDYNELKEPNQEQTVIISYLTMNSYKAKRCYNNEESKEVAAAYAKCAEMMQKYSFADNKRRSLGYNIKKLVRTHPETAAAVLKIYDKYLSDLDLIDGVRSCMSRNDKLLNQGFAVIHKMTDSICQKNNNDYAASAQLRIAFADLYGYYPVKCPDKLEKITEHFKEFTSQISRDDQSQLYWLIRREGLETQKAQVLVNILADSFRAMNDGDERDFAVIYAENKAQYAEALQNAEFCDKVKRKVKKDNIMEQAIPDISLPNSLKYNLINAGPEKPSKEKFEAVGRREQLYFGYEDPKPKGGLWTSFATKENANIGEWQEYCDKEMPIWNEHKLKGSWHIVPAEDCRILTFNKLEDVRKYIRTTQNPNRECTNNDLEQGINDYFHGEKSTLFVDYNAMAKEYDLFVMPQDCGERHPLFADWTRSALVLNFDKVKVMENDEYAKFINAEMSRVKEQFKNGAEVDGLKKAGNLELNKMLMQAHFGKFSNH